MEGRRSSAIDPAILRQEGFEPEASAGLFVGVSVFESRRFAAVPFAVDDAVDLAHLFAVELGLLLPERCVLGLAGEPEKPATAERLARLMERGSRRIVPHYTGLYRHLGEQARVARPGGLLVVTVASHGFSDQGGGDFLLASDSLPERVVRTGLAVDELFDTVARAASPRRLVLLDACRERLTKGTRAISGAPMAKSFAAAIARASGQVVLAAATLGGFAYDDGKRGNGAFTAAVLEGLRGAAPADPRGFISAGTLADFVQEQVAAWVRQHRPEDAGVSLGISRRIEGAAQSLPLAVNPQRTRALAAWRARREAALTRLWQNRGEVLDGALCLEIERMLPEERSADGSAGDAVTESLVVEIEALDGEPRSQRNLRDFVRELGEREATAAGAEAVPGEAAPSEAPGALPLPEPAPPVGAGGERHAAVPARPMPPRRMRALYIAAGVALVVLLGVWRYSSDLFGGGAGEEPAAQEAAQDALVQHGDTDGEIAHGRSESASGELEALEQAVPNTPAEHDAASEEQGALKDLEEAAQDALVQHGDTGGETARSRSKPAPGEAEALKRAVPNTLAEHSDAATEEGVVRSVPAPGTAREGPLGMRLRFIPAGRYWIGSPEDEPGRYDNETRHSVRLTRGFWLAETEVTQGQWSRLVPRNPSAYPACGENCPVEQVNWYEAVAFANLVSEEAGLPLCYQTQGCGTLGAQNYACEAVELIGLDCPGYRLPTEAEWEVAARAGSETALYTGGLTLRGQRDGPELDPIAWYSGNSGVEYGGGEDCSSWEEKQFPDKRCGTHRVAGRRANAWGLHDMLGNVWEWTWDRYGGFRPGEAVDPLGTEEGTNRVSRGGSWFTIARDVRAAYRSRLDPSYHWVNLGFRLARGPVRQEERRSPRGDRPGSGSQP